MNRLITQHRRRGAALIIVLAFVVLLTVMVVAYFTRATTDRQSAKISSVGADADQLARSALDVIVADFKQEITAGSSPTPAPPALPIYLPTPAANMLPRRSGVPAGVPDPLPNLIKRSVSPDSIVSPGIPSRASAVNSTTDLSTNSRSIGLARWNKHYLLPRFNTGTAIDYTPPSPLPAPFNPNPPVATGFTPPDWVLVTRAGPAVETGIGSGISALNNPDPLNSNYVIGRYAYAVYDEGGLIDLNVAGFPSNTTVAQVGRKGYVAFADLTQLGPPQSPQVDRIVGWRNSATAQATPSPTPNAFPLWNFDAASASRYFTAVLSNTTGFLTVSNVTWPSGADARTDQAFVTRQQLLGFRTDTGFTQNALQYLGTFCRELNRPTWSPSTPAGSTIDYAAQAENTSAINRDLATVRVTSAFTRFDGSAAVVGEPLLKARFPISRLSWLTYKGPSAAVYAGNPNDPVILALLANNVSLQTIQSGTAANIKTYFGLVWDSRAYVASPRQGQQWVYTSPNSAAPGGTFDGSTGTSAIAIKTLGLDPAHPTWSPVQSEAREPDFCEILKAVVLNGSVGLGSNSTANTFIVADPKYYDTTNGKSADYQLMQIDANILDAWDTDNVPTFISFNGNEPTGIENIPYLNKLVFTPDVPPNSNGIFDAWLVPSLWNPHQNAPGAGTVRVALTGTGINTAFGTGKNPTVVTQSTQVTLPSSMDINAGVFGTTPAAQTALPIAMVGSVTNTGPPENFYGFHYSFASSPNNNQVTQANAETAYPDFGSVSGATSVGLQIQIPGTTTFIPYQTWQIAAVASPLLCTSIKKNNNFLNSPKLQDPEFVALDPRTLRFGIWGTDADRQSGGGNTKKDYTQGATDSLDQRNPANRLEQITLYQPQGSSFTIPILGSLSLYSANSQATDYYKDFDSVQRYADFTTNDGITAANTIMYPLAPGSNDRPQILSGPFRSVAELGQVFRDQPWKTLNFTISNSGDAGLLDAFTMQDVPIVAGRTSLNTRQSAVLKAILSQAAKNLIATSVITPAERDAVVTALMNLTGTAGQPMISKGELVTRLAASSSVTALKNKEARECVVRAFSDACQTRTWNLMIDVIAQSGRYPASATGLANFLVEGEKRYWLHVAIDRLTGEVIDQQLEAVYE